MSLISSVIAPSITGTASNLVGMLQQLTSPTQSVATATATPNSSTSATNNANPTSSTSPIQALTNLLENEDGDGTGKTHGHHHRHGAQGQLFKQIQSAVTSALQGANQSGSTADPNQIIQQAIETVLKNANNPTANLQATSSTPTPAAEQSTAAGGTTSAASNQDAFTQLLKANGVDPQQFQADFVKALSDTQAGGQLNLAQIFKSFPVGSAVDTVG